MNNKSLEFLIGFVLGGITGAIITLLLAPSSGEVTRGQIRARGAELKNRGQDAGNEAKKHLRKMADDGQASVSYAQGRAGAALEERKTRVGEAIDAGRQAASQRQGELLSLLVSAGSSFEA